MSASGHLIILGAPASGKGTMCELLTQRYGYVHISTGDLLRARSRFLPELAELMNQGKLVPDETIAQVVQERLKEPDASGRGVLLDGFPRTRRQAELLREMGIPVRNAIHLDVPDEVVTERVDGRRVDPVSGRVYHVKLRPPSDEAIKARLIQRSDDTRAKVIVRLSEYHANVEQLLEFYEQELVTIKIRELLGGDGAVVTGASHQGMTSMLPLDANPEQIFDALRIHLEGARYWGTRFQTHFSIKGYECGSSAADLLSLSQFFDHLQWRMLNNGCLRETRQEAECVVRAQTLRLNWPLVTHAAATATCSVRHVGKTSVELYFALADRKRGLEFGSGTCTLVYVDSPLSQKLVTVPGRERLLQLIESGSTPSKKSPKPASPRPSMDFPQTPAGQTSTPPKHARRTELVCTPTDVDFRGGLQVTAVLRRALDAIYVASVRGGISSARLAHAPVRQIEVELHKAAQPGETVEIVVWLTPIRAELSFRMARVCFQMRQHPDSASHERETEVEEGKFGSLLASGVADMEMAVEASRL